MDDPIIIGFVFLGIMWTVKLEIYILIGGNDYHQKVYTK